MNKATNEIYLRLLPEYINELNDIIPKLDDVYAKRWCTLDPSTDHWKSLTIKFCTHFIPKSRSITCLSEQIPPTGVHMMQRADTWFVGDFYSTNMVLDCLDFSNFFIEKNKRYMDFGGSSGSLTRVLSAFEPKADCYCYDPVPESIQWAADSLPVGKYRVSPQNPPIDLPDNYFSGVTAISIWSHFDEHATMSWFNEMARLIEPGGWLFFTTHGAQTINWMKKNKRRATVVIDFIENKLNENKFHFEDVYKGSAHYGLNTQSWGNSFILPEWLVFQLSESWQLKFFSAGKNQNNQDCYIFTRKK